MLLSRRVTLASALDLTRHRSVSIEPPQQTQAKSSSSQTSCGAKLCLAGFTHAAKGSEPCSPGLSSKLLPLVTHSRALDLGNLSFSRLIRIYRVQAVFAP